MLLISLLTFTTVILNLYCGIRVFLAHRTSRINQLFLLLCLTLCFWGFGYTFMISAHSSATANWWRIFSAIGWCFLYGAFALFAIHFTDHRGLLRRPWMQALLMIPSLVFFINTTRYPDSDFILTNWGWMFPYSNDMLWHMAFLIYYSLFAAGALWMIYDWGRKADTTRVRKQAGVIVKTTLAVYALGAPVDTLLPMLGYQIVPVGVIFSTIFTAGIWYSMSHYKLMMLNFETTADYILTRMMDPVLLVSKDLMILEANQSTFALTHCFENELIGSSLATIVQTTDGSPLYQKRLFADQNASNIEVAVVDRNQVRIPCLMSFKVLYDSFNDLLGLIVVLHNITDRKKYEQLLMQSNTALETKVRERTLELEESNISLQREIAERQAAEDKVQYNANHDQLTGLPNRRLYHERLRAAIDSASDSGEAFAVLYMDLDNFKYLNDSFGHTLGDKVLEQVAQRMAKAVRHGDTLARIGGDEFLLLVEHLQVEKIREVMKTILGSLQRTLGRAFFVNGNEVFLSASVGIAVYPEDGLDPDTLVKHADIAMYEAKYSGKRTYRFCSSPMKKKVLERANIRNHLFRAIDNDELLVFYQPQIDAVSGRIAGFEALLRWRMNQEHFVSPEDFIPMAEETGLIVPIGVWVMKKALQQLRHWHDLGFPNLGMALNVSARQLKEKGFLEQMIQCLAESGVDPKRVEIEITESVAFKRDADILAMLQEVRKLDVRIAIDDFGIDHSSFTNVKLIPVDHLKIAMPFVSGIGKNTKDEAIVSSIIALSHKIGLQVIAEGVETEEELLFLRRESCDEIQGYYFYRPMPPEKIETLLFDLRRALA